MPIYKRAIEFTLLSGNRFAAHPDNILAIAETTDPATGQGAGTEVFFERRSFTVQEDWMAIRDALGAVDYVSGAEFYTGRRIVMRIDRIDNIEEVIQTGDNQFSSSLLIRMGRNEFSIRTNYNNFIADYKTVDHMQSYQVSAYAGMRNFNVGSVSLGAGWASLEGYSEDSVPKRLIDTDLVAGTLTFPYDGIYEIAMALNLDHNETNQGRKTSVRLFNVTDDVAPGDPLPISIGRNQPGLNFYGAFKVQITEDMVNKAIRLEMGGGDSISVSSGTVDYSAKMIGPFEL